MDNYHRLMVVLSLSIAVFVNGAKTSTADVIKNKGSVVSENRQNIMTSNPSYEDGFNPCWWWGETLLEDDFESMNFNQWLDEKDRVWDLSTSQYKSGLHAAHITNLKRFYEDFENGMENLGWVIEGLGAGTDAYYEENEWQRPLPPSPSHWGYLQVDSTFDSAIYVDTGIAAEDGKTYTLEYYTGSNDTGWATSTLIAEVWAGNPNDGGELLETFEALRPKVKETEFNSHNFTSGTGLNGNFFIRFKASKTVAVFEQPILDNIKLIRGAPDLISKDLDTSKTDAIRISFWYRDNNVSDSDNIRLQLYDGLNYDDITLTFPKLKIPFELGNTMPENAWHFCSIDLYNEGDQAKYFHQRFRIKFRVPSIGYGEHLWIDNVKVEISAQLTNTDAHTGANCIKLDADREYGVYKGAGSWVLGKKYQLNLWAKALGISDAGGRLALSVENNEIGSIKSDTVGWEPFSFSYNKINSDSKFSGNIQARYYGDSGTVLLDDWSIQEIHDDALPVTPYHGFLSDTNVTLRNPERGFRYERVYYDGTPTDTNFESETPPNMSLVLTYEVLIDFFSQDIPAERLNQIENMLHNVSINNMKSVIRFAYRFGEAPPGPEPTLAQLLAHIDQLAPIITNASDVISVWQAGFLGHWGEWNTISDPLDNWDAKATIVDAILKIIKPINRKIMLRRPYYKYKVLDQLGVFEEVNADNANTDAPCALIGYHNDGFLANTSDGGTWPEPPYYANPGNEFFDYMTRESSYVPVGGEMFYDDNNVAGIDAAVRMRLHHYSSFSALHAWNLSIKRWREEEYIYSDQLRKLKMPISDGYFKNDAGEDIQRSIYDYIRDHLGYRIELQWAAFPKAMDAVNDNLFVEVNLINRGFAAFVNPRQVYFVLISEDNIVYELEVTNSDPRSWQPFEPGFTGVQVGEDFLPLLHKISIEKPLPDGIRNQPGVYKLGLWLPDNSTVLRQNPNYAVRVANRDAEWVNGINILGQIAISCEDCNEISLNSGWNLISLRQQPPNTAIGEVLGATSDNCDSVWGFKNRWKAFYPAFFEHSDLDTLEAGWGYWLNMNASAMLIFTGSAPSKTISLVHGWNLVGLNSTDSLPVTVAIDSIVDDCESVWQFKDGRWQAYYPDFPEYSDLETMEPNYGYWIKTKQACIWTLP